MALVQRPLRPGRWRCLPAFAATRPFKLSAGVPRWQGRRVCGSSRLVGVSRSRRQAGIAKWRAGLIALHFQAERARQRAVVPGGRQRQGLLNGPNRFIKPPALRLSRRQRAQYHALLSAGLVASTQARLFWTAALSGSISRDRW